MTAKATSEKASPFDISKTEAPLDPPMDWTSMTISTTHRSWKMSMPTERLPCGELTSPLSVSSFNTIAVEERAIMKPRSIETGKEKPIREPAASTMATVTPTWNPPPMSPSRRMLSMRAMENSSPMVKSRRTTPICERVSTVCISVTSPKP